jgi:hypothetical protein
MAIPATGSTLKSLARWLVWPVLFLLLVLSLPFLALFGIAWILAAVAIHFAAWARGLGQPWVVLVYSDSPKWKAHIEERLIPSLSAPASVLNLSRRSQWGRLSLGRYAFRLFAGDKEYCPIALVFPPGKRVRKFRFYRPFLEAKHGKHDRLRQLEEQLAKCAGSVL